MSIVCGGVCVCMEGEDVGEGGSQDNPCHSGRFHSTPWRQLYTHTHILTSLQKGSLSPVLVSSLQNVNTRFRNHAQNTPTAGTFTQLYITKEYLSLSMTLIILNLAVFHIYYKYRSRILYHFLFLSQAGDC